MLPYVSLFLFSLFFFLFLCFFFLLFSIFFSFSIPFLSISFVDQVLRFFSLGKFTTSSSHYFTIHPGFFFSVITLPPPKKRKEKTLYSFLFFISTFRIVTNEMGKLEAAIFFLCSFLPSFLPSFLTSFAPLLLHDTALSSSLWMGSLRKLYTSCLQ